MRLCQQLELPGLTLSPIQFDTETTRFDLEFHLWEPKVEQQWPQWLWVDSSEGISGFVIYSTDLFDEATINRMLGHFQTLLEGIVANPEQPIANLPILSEQEQYQLLVEWNNTQADYPQDLCIHQLFEMHCRTESGCDGAWYLEISKSPTRVKYTQQPTCTLSKKIRGWS